MRGADAMREIVRGADVVFHVASRVQTRHTGADEVFAIKREGHAEPARSLPQGGREALRVHLERERRVRGPGHREGRRDAPLPDVVSCAVRRDQGGGGARGASRERRGRRLDVRDPPAHRVGPGDTRFLPAVLSRAKAGKLKAYVGDWDKLSDFTFVGNLVDGLLLAAESLGGDGKAAGQAYFVTNGEPTSFWSSWAACSTVSAIRAPRSRCPSRSRTVLRRRRGAGCPSGIPTSEESLTRFAIRYLTTYHYFTHAKATRDLGYRPKVDLAAGIAQTVAAMKTAGASRGTR